MSSQVRSAPENWALIKFKNQVNGDAAILIYKNKNKNEDAAICRGVCNTVSGVLRLLRPLRNTAFKPCGVLPPLNSSKLDCQTKDINLPESHNFEI